MYEPATTFIDYRMCHVYLKHSLLIIKSEVNPEMKAAADGQTELPLLNNIPINQLSCYGDSFNVYTCVEQYKFI